VYKLIIAAIQKLKHGKQSNTLIGFEILVPVHFLT
jgi:hypothetical protein